MEIIPLIEPAKAVGFGLEIRRPVIVFLGIRTIAGAGAERNKRGENPSLREGFGRL